ncbi:Phosphoribosylglycinamide formyltransferase [Candidatus Kinetoplastibacterium sorsogonicusi]|uniref:Phosphoribosylglycinamide formyltransferase n=1 Tax=Candidatus Kinetoplastidibacterium kentomonadis TaxID=1576550 RepID=A0A3Q8ER59_9PROT|nr:phosphoribosylglycinamide formyltransferase [Candidatus Kinetoplastibacterium sorsogonicusi]AWD32346.1 Phosphoribosylglycinamide formyltransferase [Candidatus Kinetoplastibacterium sorsogonicusi]
MTINTQQNRKKLVILISGRGSNMLALLKANITNKWPAEICCVISNNLNAEGIKSAQSLGINTKIINHLDYNSREEFDEALLKEIDKSNPDYIILAGFMRILTETFVKYYYGRLINIHPSLLPLFKGLNTHERVLNSGLCFHGCTVHFVTPLLDDGPIIAQGIVPVYLDDTIDTLSNRVLQIEHITLVNTVEWLIYDYIQLNGNIVKIKNKKHKLFIME